VTPLGTAVRELLADAAIAYAGRPEQEVVTAMGRRLEQPLRVAIAGRVKAGKSTLLNALVGERLAATDAGECTTVLTWYLGGVAARAWAHPRQGQPRQLPFDRVDGRTVLGLGPFRAADLLRVVVEVPSSRLERLTLIDTPGIGSVNAEVSRRTIDALGRAGPRPPVADAVLYLMRHLHASDVGFLEAFHDEQFHGVTPVNAIGVLSRADEVGAGRTDALDVARRVAASYRREPRVRGLVQAVVPVAGLLAEAGVALRERDHAALAALAAAGPDGDALMLSADRFAAEGPGTPVPAAVRRELLGLMALSGVRLAVALIRSGAVSDSTQLARELVRRSGLEDLRALLLTQFTERRDLLKAQNALHALERILAAHPVAGAQRLQARLEAVLTGAHELTELRLLNDLRTGVVELPGEDVRDDAEALLGVGGTDVRARLRLAADAPAEQIRPALIAALRRWQRHAGHPAATPALRRVAAVLRRTCEGQLAALSGPRR
jgi:50S ribosome-binding GTPase